MIGRDQGRGVPILAYHRISDTPSAIDTPARVFLKTMHRLIDAGWRCIRVDEWIEAGTPEVERAFGLTFDDGDRSILDVINWFSTLHLTASVFLVTDHVGGSNDWPGQPAWATGSKLLDWSEIRDLHKLGIGFGSHTRTHPDLSKLAIPLLEAELVQSRQAIENQLGVPCPLLAYPYGHRSHTVRRRAGELYRAAFGTRQGLASHADTSCDLPRIDAHYLQNGQLIDRIINCKSKSWLELRNHLRTARRLVRRGVPG